MTLVERTLQAVLSIVFAISALFLFGDGFRLMAEWRISVMNGIFMLGAGLLAAIVFAFRATEAGYSWPHSIIKAR